MSWVRRILLASPVLSGTLISHFFTGGYEFLMENCTSIGKHYRAEKLILVTVLDQEGDKICIFGFSRGAYTARALAGMIQKVCMLHHIWVRCNLIGRRWACSPRETANKFLSHIKCTVAMTKLGGSKVPHSRKLSRSMLR